MKLKDVHMADSVTSKDCSNPGKMYLFLLVSLH